MKEIHSLSPVPLESLKRSSSLRIFCFGFCSIAPFEKPNTSLGLGSVAVENEGEGSKIVSGATRFADLEDVVSLSSSRFRLAFPFFFFFFLGSTEDEDEDAARATVGRLLPLAANMSSISEGAMVGQERA